jgi:hypothetical protein
MAEYFIVGGIALGWIYGSHRKQKPSQMRACQAKVSAHATLFQLRKQKIMAVLSKPEFIWINMAAITYINFAAKVACMHEATYRLHGGCSFAEGMADIAWSWRVQLRQPAGFVPPWLI